LHLFLLPPFSPFHSLSLFREGGREGGGAGGREGGEKERKIGEEERSEIVST
jgi:hypothetical protein